MLGNFPKSFSQASTSQGYLSIWELPKCEISKFPILAAALDPIIASQGLNEPLGSCPLGNFKFGNLPLVKLPP